MARGFGHESRFFLFFFSFTMREDSQIGWNNVKCHAIAIAIYSYCTWIGKRFSTKIIFKKKKKKKTTFRSFEIGTTWTSRIQAFIYVCYFGGLPQIFCLLIALQQNPKKKKNKNRIHSHFYSISIIFFGDCVGFLWQTKKKIIIFIDCDSARET